jgi:hypothetical protein
MAIYANLTIDQGSAFESSVDVTGADGSAIDLTTYTVRGQIRKSYQSSTAVDFVTTKNADGEIGLSITSSTSGGIKAGRYVYDVEIESSAGVVTRVLEGQVEVTPRVTQTS